MRRRAAAGIPPRCAPSRRSFSLLAPGEHPPQCGQPEGGRKRVGAVLDGSETDEDPAEVRGAVVEEPGPDHERVEDGGEHHEYEDRDPGGGKVATEAF